MRIIVGVVAAAVLCGMLVGCAGVAWAPVVPPMAFVYSDVKAPIDVDVNNTPMTGKKGTASTINVLGLVATGDASIKAAAQDGGLKTVDHVDYEMLNVLGIFSKFTVVAYGQQ